MPVLVMAGLVSSLAGVALERLHRAKQAAAMYRLAMKYEDWIAPFMKARLEQLGEVEGG